MTKVHALKTWPNYFKDVVNGSKTFEVRKNDRNFKVGDFLMLREYDPEDDTYTGEVLYQRVSYVLDDPRFVKDGYVILGLSGEVIV